MYIYIYITKKYYAMSIRNAGMCAFRCCVESFFCKVSFSKHFRNKSRYITSFSFGSTDLKQLLANYYITAHSKGGNNKFGSNGGLTFLFSDNIHKSPGQNKNKQIYYIASHSINSLWKNY